MYSAPPPGAGGYAGAPPPYSAVGAPPPAAQVSSPNDLYEMFTSPTPLIESKA